MKVVLSYMSEKTALQAKEIIGRGEVSYNSYGARGYDLAADVETVQYQPDQQQEILSPDEMGSRTISSSPTFAVNGKSVPIPTSVTEVGKRVCYTGYGSGHSSLAESFNLGKDKL